MGVIGDMQDVLQTVMNLLTSYNNEGELVGDLLDELYYSGDYRYTRSYLEEMGMEFMPHTQLKIARTEDGAVGIFDATNDLHILWLDEADQPAIDAEYTDEDIFALVYEKYWVDIEAHYEG